MGFPPLSLFLLPLFFFFFLLPFFSSWLCPVLTSWAQLHFLCNSETCGRRQEPMWTSSLICTHFHPLWPTQHPSLTFVLTLLSFLAPFVHLFRGRVKGHWVGPSPLHKKSPSSTRILGKTKTEKKNRCTEGKSLPKLCYWIPSDLFRASCFAYNYETKQTPSPASGGQLDFAMETKSVPLGDAKTSGQKARNHVNKQICESYYLGPPCVPVLMREGQGIFVFNVVREIDKIMQTKISGYHVQADHSPMVFLPNPSDTSITCFSFLPNYLVLVYPYLPKYTPTSLYLTLYLSLALEKETIYFLSNFHFKNLNEKQWLGFIHCCIPKNHVQYMANTR